MMVKEVCYFWRDLIKPLYVMADITIVRQYLIIDRLSRDAILDS